MIGKLQMINTQSHIGKIIFKNDLESIAMVFPPNFETGDTIEAKFKNDDMTTKPIQIIGYSENCFGFIMQQYSKILPTYPKLLNLVSYQSTTTPENNLSKVSFRLHKTMDGKTVAIDVQKASSKDLYKCNMPQFGMIDTSIREVKEGFISDIVEKTYTQNMLSGKIKFTIEDRGFGFITTQQSGDVFFRLDAYSQFYGTAPIKNATVHFYFKEAPQGRQVEAFCDPQSYLPIDKQYGKIDNYTFLLQDYEKFYHKKAELGDVIYYIVENNSILFQSEQKNIEESIFRQTQSQIVENYFVGEITSIKEKFGSIHNKQKNNTVSFRLYDFKLCYKKSPKVGDKVAFTQRQNDKGWQVDHFIKEQHKTTLTQTAFQNFVTPLSNQLYFAYIDKNKAKEVFIYDPTQLSQSIACYKDQKIAKHFKLQAIECLLKNNYESKNISIQTLKTEKINILNQLTTEAISKADGISALKYETEFQATNYNPKRIARLEAVSQKGFESVIPIHQYQSYETSEYYECNIRQNQLEIKPIDLAQKYDIIEKTCHCEPLSWNEKIWQITTNLATIKPYTTKEKWNITI